MQNLLEIQNALRSAPDQQLMGLMQGANSSVPQWAVASEMNSRKEMRDEQTRQEGLGQPTVLQQLTGTAPAPTPQTNVAGMPQGVASGMAQSMAPKTDVPQNTGIASVAPVATMASGGILKMAPGGAVNQVIVTFAEDSPIYPGETRRMTQDTLEAMPRNSVQDVKGVADVGGVEAAKKVPYLPMSGGLKRQLKTIESESFPLIDTSDRNNVPPDNYGVSASLPPADGAMYSSPTGGQGGNTDPSRLGLPKDEFSQVPVSSMSTPVGLATLAAAGDADVRGETPVVNTSTLSEKELRKQADNRNEAGRARFELMKALEATNSKGQPGGTLGKRYAESDDDLRMVDAQRYIESLIKGDPYSGELSPSQTARNQKTLSDTLRREEMQRQRDAIERQGMESQEEIARENARGNALAALGEIDRSSEPALFRQKASIAGERQANALRADPAMFGDMPFNATSDEAAKKSVSQATLANIDRDKRVARVTADEPGTELAVAAKTDPMQMTDTEIRNASQGLIPYDMSMAADGAQDPKPITIDSAVKPSAEVTNAQLEAFTTDRVNPFAFNKAPETTEPEVFDPLEGLFMYQALADDPPTDDKNYDAKTIIKRINELKTPEEKAATLTMLNNRYIDAEQEVERLKEKYERVRIASKSGTGNYAIDEKAGIGTGATLGSGSLTDISRERIAAENNLKSLYENIGGLIPASGRGSKFALEGYFGEDTVNALNKLETDNLQAEAVADVAKVTANENYPVSPVEVRRRLRAMEDKDVDADERFDLAEARLDAERAEGLTAGEDAFVAPSKTKPFVPLYGGKFAENSAFLNDEADYDGSSMNGLNTDGPFMPNEDTRIKRMKALAEQINSGELTGNSLLSAQKTLERLRKGVVRSGGEEELGNYLAKQTAQGVKKALPYAVDTADYVVRNLGLGTLAGATLGPRAEGFLLDKTDAAQTNTANPVAEIPTSANEVAAEAIASSVSKGDLTGPKPSGSVSLGAAITDSQKEQAAINAAQGIDELSFLNNDSNAEVQRRAGLYKDAFTEQDAINAELERKKAEAALAAAVGPVPPPAGAPMPFSKDSTDSAEQFYNNLPLLDQSVKNGNVVTPATRTGIATINPMDNRASDSPSSYEQKLLDILDKREKSADQDKWLGLAEMGMRLMASSNPNLLSAIGEAGLGASQTFLGNKQKAETQEMDILTKLSALEARKQIADDANRTRLQAASISRSGKPAAGSYASVNQALSGIKAQITAIEGSMPPQPPTESRALDAYNKQIATLNSLREQEKRLMSTNPVVASIFANVDGTNTPAAVDLS